MFETYARPQRDEPLDNKKKTLTFRVLSRLLLCQKSQNTRGAPRRQPTPHVPPGLQTKPRRAAPRPAEAAQEYHREDALHEPPRCLILDISNPPPIGYSVGTRLNSQVVAAARVQPPVLRDEQEVFAAVAGVC